MRTFFSSFAVVLFLAVLVGCGSTSTTSKSEPKGATDKVVQVPKASPVARLEQPPALTAEQITRNEQIALAARIVQLAHEGGANKDLPKWVADRYKANEAEGYTRDKTAFQRSVGWGTGMYRGRGFYWFAYTNTDAYLQYDFSVPVTGTEDLAKIISRKDGYGRLREAALPSRDRDQGFNPETQTWIGDTNDWTDANCAQPRYDPCDLGAALKKSVAYLNKDLPGLNLVIKGKFPW